MNVRAHDRSGDAHEHGNGGRRTVVLLGWFGGGNFGNDMSLRTAVETLRELDPGVQLTCACMVPSVVQARFSVDACAIRPGLGENSGGPRVLRMLRRVAAEPRVWAEVRRVLRVADVLIAPGTGLFDDYGLRAHQAPYDVWRWSMLARLTRTPFMMIGMGAGPVERRSIRALLRPAARRASYASFRDRASLDFMTGLGRDTRNDRVVPDIVFANEPPMNPTTDPPEPAGGVRPLTVGVDVMGYYGWTAGDSRRQEIHDTYVAELVRLIAAVLDAGHDVRLLRGQLNDEETIVEVLDALGNGVDRAGQLRWEPIPDFEGLQAVVGVCDVVIITRYHVMIASLLAHRPTMSIGYAGKIDAIMDRAGLGDMTMFIETFRAAEAMENFERLVAEREERTATIAQFVRAEHDAARAEMLRACRRALDAPTEMRATR